MSRLINNIQTCLSSTLRAYLVPGLLVGMCTLYSFPAIAEGPAASPDHPVSYTLGYAGNNLWNPGLEAGAAILIHAFPVRSGKREELLRELYLKSGIGIYLDPGSHAGLYNQYGAAYRRTGQKEWSHSFEVLPAGIYRSFLPETWRVETGAAPEKVILPGRTYYAPGVGYQLGRNTRENIDLSWFVGCSITVLIPYNTYVMPVLTIDMGWRFSGRKEGK